MAEQNLADPTRVSLHFSVLEAGNTNIYFTDKKNFVRKVIPYESTWIFCCGNW